MKVHELFEDELEDMNRVLLLMKHGRLSKDKATELAKKLQEAKIWTRGRFMPANLRWVEDKLSGTLKFISADIPGSWRSGTAAMSRHEIKKTLMDYGFMVGGFQAYAAMRKSSLVNDPHIFFWGPGTPPMNPDNLKKINGTPENREETLRKIQASTKK